MPKLRLLICMKHSLTAQSSMSQLSSLAVDSHGRRLHLVEALPSMTTLKHAHLRLAAIEEDYPHPILDPREAEDTVLHRSLEEVHHQGGMGFDQPQEIVIWTLTARARSLVQDQDHEKHAPGPTLLGRGLGLPHVEIAPMDIEIAHRHREEAGEEGVLASPAFPATAIEAVAGVEVVMDTVGGSMLSESVDWIRHGSYKDISLKLVL